MIQSGHDKCRVLIVEHNEDVRAGLARELNQLGHEVTLEGERDKAVARADLDQFDLMVSDLIDHDTATEAGSVRSFKMGVTSLPARRKSPSCMTSSKRPSCSS